MYNIFKFSGWTKRILDKINRIIYITLFAHIELLPVKGLLRWLVRKPRALESTNLHKRDGAGSYSVLQMILVLVYRLYNTQGGKLCSRATLEAKEALCIINNSLY